MRKHVESKREVKVRPEHLLIIIGTLETLNTKIVSVFLHSGLKQKRKLKRCTFWVICWLQSWNCPVISCWSEWSLPSYRGDVWLLTLYCFYRNSALAVKKTKLSREGQTCVSFLTFAQLDDHDGRGRRIVFSEIVWHEPTDSRKVSEEGGFLKPFDFPTGNLDYW